MLMHGTHGTVEHHTKHQNQSEGKLKHIFLNPSFGVKMPSSSGEAASTVASA